MSTLIDPSRDAVAITPSDTVDIKSGQFTRGLYVGGAGTIVAVMGNNTAVTFANAVAGSVLPIRVTRINATGTTATSLVGLF